MTHYQLVVSEAAKDELRQLPQKLRQNIGNRITYLQNGLVGDIKKLRGEQHHYRLRVGVYRVLFQLDGNVIEVYAVRQRKDAYE